MHHCGIHRPRVARCDLYALGIAVNSPEYLIQRWIKVRDYGEFTDKVRPRYSVNPSELKPGRTFFRTIVLWSEFRFRSTHRAAIFGVTQIDTMSYMEAFLPLPVHQPNS